jgi:pimeloyl-ACP methyl ester carboxylesterase
LDDATREVILFDDAGIAGSTGEVPQTFAGMAKNAGFFIDALGLTQVDILGFSIGSMVAQMIFTNKYGNADDFWMMASSRRRLRARQRAEPF